MLFLQLLEACPTLSFINTAPCQNNVVSIKYWGLSFVLASGGAGYSP